MELISKEYEELDNKILLLLTNWGFSQNDIGTLLYKEIIKHSIEKLIKISETGKDKEAKLYGEFLSDICNPSSNFYNEIFEIISKDSSGIFNGIYSVLDIHNQIKKTSPISDEPKEGETLTITRDTYMLKAHGFAYSIMYSGIINSSIINNNGNINDKDNGLMIVFDYYENEILTLLSEYGFDVEDLGTHCYMKVIKNVIRYLEGPFDNYEGLKKIIKTTLKDICSVIYIEAWQNMAVSKEILCLKEEDKNFEFSFPSMNPLIRKAIFASDLGVNFSNDRYTEMMSANIIEIAEQVIEKLKIGSNQKNGVMRKVRRPVKSKK